MDVSVADRGRNRKGDLFQRLALSSWPRTAPRALASFGGSHVEVSHYVRILVAKLRQKLGDNAAWARYIATELGVDLRFIPSNA